MLELLAPARDINIGIAAIDCGADAVYIAGPQFGARQAAGNSVEDISKLCDYAHQFGAKIFVTLNTILYDSELKDAYRFMLQVQEAGADAIIVQDLAVIEMARNGYDGIEGEVRIPLHASTQCAIRTPEQARFLESLGFSRLILERELSLEQIKAIRNAVSCELEFFVHGALCVCYSGQCYLSENLAGRSANRGSCIQACRSLYDLVDESGKVLVRNKALLSLKDYNLRSRIGDLAEAGINSFKIEGRLKNESYVRNVVRDYSIALDNLIESHGAKYERGSFGKVSGGFTPDLAKTFNRGYTDLFIDGKRGKWAAMDAAKSMGEIIGTVISTSRAGVQVKLNKGVTLNNGDGFSFVARNGKVEGFRGDVCYGNMIKGRISPSLSSGTLLYRNINAAFEKDIERQACTREIQVATSLEIRHEEGKWIMTAVASTEDGRQVRVTVDAGTQMAENQERMSSMLGAQIGKSTGHYKFILTEVTADQGLPFMSTSALNGIRRTLAERIDEIGCIAKPLLDTNLKESVRVAYPESEVTYRQNISNRISEEAYSSAGTEVAGKAYELEHPADAELMRTKYCIRYELGICPVHHKNSQSPIKADVPLFLVNNGKRLALHFDCRRCEMTVTL